MFILTNIFFYIISHSALICQVLAIGEEFNFNCKILMTKTILYVIILTVGNRIERFLYMKVYQTKNFKIEYPCAVALGCFDGVHLGHRAVIERTVGIACGSALRSAVFSFSSSPRNFFSPNSAPVITAHQEKSALIEDLGVDIFVCYPFDADTAASSPRDFFENVLIGQLGATHIVCGFNYTFGKGGKGNADTLRELCNERGIGFTQLPPIDIDGVTVSSSVIRSALEAGDMELAERFLGHTYRLAAEVSDGQHLATKLGFPTLNQVFEKNILIPKRGVYLSRATVDEKKYFGISNIGIRPTVESDILCAETHLFDFDRDIYGKRVSVELLRFMRPEIKFPSVDTLAERVREDIKTAKNIILEYQTKKV